MAVTILGKNFGIFLFKISLGAKKIMCLIKPVKVLIPRIIWTALPVYYLIHRTKLSHYKSFIWAYDTNGKKYAEIVTHISGGIKQIKNTMQQSFVLPFPAWARAATIWSSRQIVTPSSRRSASPWRRGDANWCCSTARCRHRSCERRGERHRG